MSRMNAEIKAQWTEALRSGHFTQGTSRLNSVTDTGDEYCCLGVLCHLAAQQGVVTPALVTSYGGYSYRTYDSAAHYLPLTVAEWAGLEDTSPIVSAQVYEDDPALFNRSLASLNDMGQTFAQIADIIDAQL